MYAFAAINIIKNRPNYKQWQKVYFQQIGRPAQSEIRETRKEPSPIKANSPEKVPDTQQNTPLKPISAMPPQPMSPTVYTMTEGQASAKPMPMTESHNNPPIPQPVPQSISQPISKPISQPPDNSPPIQSTLPPIISPKPKKPLPSIELSPPSTQQPQINNTISEPKPERPKEEIPISAPIATKPILEPQKIESNITENKPLETEPAPKDTEVIPLNKKDEQPIEIKGFLNAKDVENTEKVTSFKNNEEPVTAFAEENKEIPAEFGNNNKFAIKKSPSPHPIEITQSELPALKKQKTKPFVIEDLKISEHKREDEISEELKPKAKKSPVPKQSPTANLPELPKSGSKNLQNDSQNISAFPPIGGEGIRKTKTKHKQEFSEKNQPKLEDEETKFQEMLMQGNTKKEEPIFEKAKINNEPEPVFSMPVQKKKSTNFNDDFNDLINLPSAEPDKKVTKNKVEFPKEKSKYEIDDDWDKELGLGNKEPQQEKIEAFSKKEVPQAVKDTKKDPDKFEDDW